jgi:hypothetical protein
MNKNEVALVSAGDHSLMASEVEAMPEPTFEAPHLQIDWVWQRFMRRYENVSTLKGLKINLSAYKRFLNAVNGYDERLKVDSRFFLSVNWDFFAIHNAEKFWRESTRLSSVTVGDYVRSLRQVIEFAAEEGLTAVRDFSRPSLCAVPEGTDHEAYDEQELILIRPIIQEGVSHASKIAAGYAASGVGRDPRSLVCSPNMGEQWENWKDWENMVWYFENVMNCRASSGLATCYRCFSYRR